MEYNGDAISDQEWDAADAENLERHNQEHGHEIIKNLYREIDDLQDRIRQIEVEINEVVKEFSL